MKLCVPRPLVNAIIDPSGENLRPEALPRALTSRAGASLPLRSTLHIWPRDTQAMRDPLGDAAIPLPGPSRLGAPPTDGTTKTACSVPSCNCAGLGDSPCRLAPSPRTNAIIVASLVNVGSVIHWPSSAV